MSQYEKRILITGMAGFIASNVIIEMVKRYPNCLFVGLDKISYCSSMKNFSGISDYSNFIFVKGDITSLDLLDLLFKDYQIDHVMHFAAYTHVDRSFGNSIQFTKNNVLGTHYLLETSRKYKIKLFLHVSTDEVYGSKHTTSTEETILAPTNPYAATKAAAEHLVRSYYHSYKLPIIITRGNNVYGRHQYPEKVIPKFALLLFEGKKCTIHGKGGQKRSFLYIDDTVEAFITIFEKGGIGETYNIGLEEEHSILDLTKLMIEIIKDDKDYSKYIEFVEDRLFNDKRYHINCDKLKSLGWEQRVGLKEGLKLTIDWYRKNRDWFVESEK